MKVTLKADQAEEPISGEPPTMPPPPLKPLRDPKDSEGKPQ